MHRLGSITICVCMVCGLAGRARAEIRSIPYASGFESPVAFVQDPTNPAVQFVVEKLGRIRVIADGAVLPTDFLDLSSVITADGERGLLGLAFAPDYAASGRFFVNFTNNTDGNTVIARFTRTSNPLVADPSSRFDLRWGGASGPPFIEQPYANHNGGNLAFGPDGYLYIGLGDGGAGSDPGHRAQDPTLLLGKMLRIDVNVPDGHASGYVVPADNPFVGGGGPVAARPEIWAFGLRNPWRYSFDDPARGGTGALIIGDVGQGVWEEIDYEPPNHGGRNYGWRNREGAHDHVTSLPPAYLPLVDPTYEYDHSVGNVVTGGLVYRGTALGAAYRGRYFFADFGFGRIWSLALTIDPMTGEATASDLREHTSELGGRRIRNVSSFGVDADGEMYLVDYGTGTIHKILGPQTDVNGDGRADLVWRNYTTGDNRVWQMNGAIRLASVALPNAPNPNWELAAMTDIDGDGHADLVWRNNATGNNAIWFLNGTTLLRTMGLPSAGLQWRLVATADFNGDGFPDLVWRDTASGSNVVWYLNGRMMSGLAALPSAPNPAWQIVGAGDLNGDGHPDLVWHDLTNGNTFVWYLDDTTLLATANLPTISNVQWEVVAVLDLNGDGHPDLVWHDTSSGDYEVWYLSGTVLMGNALLPVSERAWTIAHPNLDRRPRNDLNGDGRADLVWRNYATGDNRVWHMNGAARLGSAALASLADPRWILVTTTDLDGDGQADLLWRNVVTGSNVVWYLNGTTLIGTAMLPPANIEWRLVAAADVNGDGRPDLVWRNIVNGSNAVWFLDGTSIMGLASLPSAPDPSWQVVGAVDLNNDGHPDLVWHNVMSGANVVWYLNGVTLMGMDSLPSMADARWKLVAVVDLNGDGQPDLVAHDSVTGAHIVWYLNGATLVDTATLPASDSGWTIIHPNVTVPPPSDVDGDGRADLVWRNYMTGENRVWFMDGAVRLGSAALPSQTDTNWTLVTTVDVDGDGHADLLWRNVVTGENIVWFMNGASVVGTASLPSASPQWRLAAAADINSDGRPDLLWRNTTTGSNVVWYMSGTMMTGFAALPSAPNQDWQLVGSGDLNGDGHTDLVWHNATRGTNVVWYLDGTALLAAAGLPGMSDPSWRVVAVMDLNGDGQADLVFHDIGTGALVVWYLNGATLAGAAELPASESGWTIAR